MSICADMRTPQVAERSSRDETTKSLSRVSKVWGHPISRSLDRSVRRIGVEVSHEGVQRIGIADMVECSMHRVQHEVKSFEECAMKLAETCSDTSTPSARPLPKRVNSCHLLCYRSSSEFTKKYISYLQFGRHVSCSTIKTKESVKRVMLSTDKCVFLSTAFFLINELYDV